MSRGVVAFAWLPAVTLGGLIKVIVRYGLLRVIAEVVRPVHDWAADGLPFRGRIFCTGLCVSMVVSLAHAHVRPATGTQTRVGGR